MAIYKLIVETVAYVEASSASNAEAVYNEGGLIFEDSVITSVSEVSKEEFDEVLDVFT